jgi:hypothetical protein
MERIWGGARSTSSTEPDYSAGTRAETENIAFDLVYLDYTSPIGKFLVGYMPDYVWGTAFGDRGNGGGVGQIQYFMQSGPFIGFVGYAKEADKSYSAVSSQSWNFINRINATRTDRDDDSYRIAGIYNFKAGEAGLLILWNRSADHKGWASTGTAPFYAPIPYLQNFVVLDPYAKVKIGPVALQAEFQYWFGDAAKWENDVSPLANVSLGAMSLFLDATATFGPVYVGGSFAYLSGDDPGTADKIEGSVNTAGLDWNPCLIMFNTETAAYWVGGISGYNTGVGAGSYVDSEMSNAYFFQGRVGVKPIPQLDAMLSVSYATADKKPAGFQNGSYGWEIDATGTYKITNNLSYMLGVGYLFTGDYFKGLSNDQKTNDDYMLINKLTLTF